MKITQSQKFDPNHLTACDVLIIVPLVLGMSVLGIAFAFSVGHDTYIRWGGLALDTAVLFAFFLNTSRQFLRRQRFWMLTVCLLPVHLAVGIVFLMHVGDWRLAWFTAMVLELPIFLHLRNRPNFIEPVSPPIRKFGKKQPQMLRCAQHDSVFEFD
ncbi:MAG: hypothetical protein ABSE87_14715 [Terracidiphilus sp.]|jgi:hypothetical protein